jgi:hypothetical protein
MADPSFYYAIYKKLQALAFAHGAHNNADNDPNDQFYGGFSLRFADATYGIFTQLGPAATFWGYTPGMKPLNAASNVPAENPMWAILNASLQPNPPDKIPVNGVDWPVMPPPLPGETVFQTYPEWQEFNPDPASGKPRVIDALATWITNGKVKDYPQSAPIDTATLNNLPQPKFPKKPSDSTPILYVCSYKGDDGRRAGDGALPDPPTVQVPPHFWNTSQIFLTNNVGVIQHPAHLQPGSQYYVAAVIGNSVPIYAGRMYYAGKTMIVRGDALAFNTFMGPNVPLPSAAELDPTSTEHKYEQYYMRFWAYDVVGFRFDVDTVFKGLVQAVTDQVPPAMLGGATPTEWVKDSHPCVKVRITSGEVVPNDYLPVGAIPSLDHSPLQDRHIAQRNLAPFDMSQMAIKKPGWTKFIVAQAGTGVNALYLQHALPLDRVQVLLAIPHQVYERYIDPRHSKGGAIHGLEIVRDVPRPFPADAVILRQTHAGAVIHVAEHTRERYFGLALGLEGDPARLRDLRVPELAIAHARQDGLVMGGFTLQLRATR